MTIKVDATKNDLAAEYGATCPYGAIYTSVPGAAAGTEPTGGTPAYARLLIPWGAPVGGVITGVVTFDVPAGTTIFGGGVHTAVTGGNYRDGFTVTEQTFAVQGTVDVTFTYTQV